jgi:hypothetical protein
VISGLLAATPMNTLVDGPSMLAGVLMAGGVAILATMLLIRARRRARRSAARERPVVGQPPRTPDTVTARTLEQLMVEVQELTRLCAAQMENRAVRLEKLIRDADERLERLERAGGGATTSPHLHRPQVEVRGGGTGALGGRAGAPLMATLDGPDPLTRQVYRLADDGRSAVEIARELDEQIGKVDLILALRDR